MHRNGTRLLAGLVGLLALLGPATAQTALPDVALPATPTGVPTGCDAIPSAPAPSAPVPTLPVPSVPAALTCAADADPTDHAVGGHASATTPQGSGLVDADAGHSEPAEAAEGGFFAWISLRFNLVILKLSELCGLAGQEAPATDGALDLRLGDDGLGLDGALAGLTLADTPYPEAESKANGLLREAGGHAGDAKGQTNAIKNDAEGTLKGILG